jgi:hypothetical protein
MSEYVRVTCLDRARVALEDTGQHHCALVMGRLQEAIDSAADELDADPNHPVEIVDDLLSAVQIIGLFEEKDDET